MELHQLEYLVAIADLGSVTRAAETLRVAQPSISQQLRKLERELGQPLFDRLPRGVALTEAGRRMLDHARKILAGVRDARRDVADVRAGVCGTLVVGTIPTIAPFLIPEVAGRFMAEHPGVALTLVEDVTGRLVEMLDAAVLDLAVTSSIEGSGRVLVEKVATEPLVLLVPAAHRLAARPSITFAALKSERFLVLNEMHCLAGQVERFCAASAIGPRVFSRGAQLATIAAMVSFGLGISIVPEMMRAHDTSSTRVYREFTGAAPHRELNLAWGPDRYRTNAAREFAGDRARAPHGAKSTKRGTIGLTARHRSEISARASRPGFRSIEGARSRTQTTVGYDTAGMAELERAPHEYRSGSCDGTKAGITRARSADDFHFCFIMNALFP